MVKTKNKSKKIPKKSSKSKKIIIIAIALMILSGLFLIAYNYNIARKDKLTEETLGEYKIKIEKVSKAIEQKYGQKPELKEYCYRTAEEFSQGVIFCTQEMSFNQKNGSEPEMINQLINLEKIFKQNDLPYANQKYNFINNIVSINNQDEKSNRVYCNSRIFAYGSSYSDEELLNAAKISLSCTGGDFRKPIYPMQ